MNPADTVFGYLRQKSFPVGSENELFHLFFKTAIPNNPAQHTILNGILEDDGRFAYDSYNKMWYANSDYTEKNIRSAEYAVIDIETTGFNHQLDKITEIAVVKIVKGEITQHLEFLVNPNRSIPYKITEITGIDNEMVLDKPLFKDMAQSLIDFLGTCVLVAHHSSFDIPFINVELKNAGLKPLQNISVCTCQLARKLIPHLPNYSLDTLANTFELTFLSRHRAYPDALVTAQVFQRYFPMLEENNIQTLGQLLKLI